MFTKVLLYIKHNLKFLWKVIDWSNAWLFCVLYNSRLESILPVVFGKFTIRPYSFRRLHSGDAEALFNLINRQDKSDLEYFKPHGFDLDSIKKQFKVSSFIMMGSFDDDKMTGYFFLRFFANKKCFVGRLIDKDYRGKGIGPVMNNMMYETAWRMRFRCLSTISKHNIAVMKAHARNQNMVVLKELQNDYLLVEFVKEAQSAERRAQSTEHRV